MSNHPRSSLDRMVSGVRFAIALDAIMHAQQRLAVDVVQPRKAEGEEPRHPSCCPLDVAATRLHPDSRSWTVDPLWF